MKEKLIKSLTITICFISTLSVKANANFEIKSKDIISVENSIISNKTNRPSLYIGNLGRSYNTYYNLQDYIELKVKNQGNTNRCWACSLNSAVESTASKQLNKDYILSEEYLDTQTDKTYKKENNMGNNMVSLGFYTSGNTPQTITGQNSNLEIEDYKLFPSIYKYQENGEIVYTSNNTKSSQKYNLQQVEKVRNEIKQQIMDNGAVTATTYASGKNYYNNVENPKAYYCNNIFEAVDHQVTIIGWDDNYSVDNFNPNCKPNNPGAYIIMNSYGEGIFEKGILYISYEDSLIEGNILGIEKVTNKDYNNIYQYDELGLNTSVTFSNQIYGMNVFNRSNQNTEYLTEISIGNLATQSYEIYVNTTNSIDQDSFQKVATVENISSGYHTIKLDNKIKLTNQKFAVMVKYILNSTTNTTNLGIEQGNDGIWANATNNKEESYISLDGKDWTDVKEFEDVEQFKQIFKSANISIKAFTTNENTRYNILEEGYITNILPETNIEEFKKQIDTQCTVTSDSIIKTGDTIKIGTKEYKAVVIGDLNGDGKLSQIDLVKIKQHVIKMKDKLLKNEFLKAADLNEDGSVNLIDLVRIKQIIINMRKLV